MTLDVHDLDRLLLVGAGVLLLAILAVRLSVRAGMPSLLVYLAIGLALGEAGLGFDFDDAEVALALGFGALVLILAEGGLTTPWPEMRPVLRIGVGLATIGVAVSVLVIALFAHYVLGLDWQLAVLLGAVLSPTDAAAVFSVLRRVPLPRRITGALEAESGLNDAPTIVLVTLVTAGGHSVTGFALDFVYQLSVGVAGGLAIGWLGAWMLRRSALPASGLYPLAVLSLCVLSYAAVAHVHASGFAAVYVAALVLGNADLPHRAATRSFAEGLAWLAQIGLFVMLGLLASPGRISLETVVLAVVVGVVLGVVARPLSVLASSSVQRVSLREGAFLSWAGLRGAVPIVFTTIPLAGAVDGAPQLFDIVFVLVVLDTLVTATTLPWASRVLGVARRQEPRDLEVEAAPLERVAADLLQVTISTQSRMHGVEVGELRLPPGTSVALVVRDGHTLVPDPRTVLRHGDDLLVVTPREEREAAEKRLRMVSLGGRLAQWLSTDPPA
ncbi:potassium/proton antiporter [Nocardioides aequoreus]|uniref:potassium/proton antiporter n=1 Tax=Nocardioides aequoreus TaxID=397278 RepID=UPI0004C3CF99|nr:potassium/proton antiporter [Nocardioides aequoreus]